MIPTTLARVQKVTELLVKYCFLQNNTCNSFVTNYNESASNCFKLFIFWSFSLLTVRGAGASLIDIVVQNWEN